MKNLKNILALFVSLVVLMNCQDDDRTIGEIIAPSNIEVAFNYIDEGEVSAAPGLGSGVVEFSVSATNATSYHFVIQGVTKPQTNGVVSHNFSVLGTNTYTVTVIAYGTGGSSSSKTIEVEVLSLYEPPADLLEMLYGTESRVWRIKSEAAGHFGLGAPNGDNPFGYFAAGADSKAGVGMYDDRYIFNQDGTFTHITDATNDEPTVDPSGTVFGREILIDELGGSGGEADGADILNYIYSDYTAQWSLSAPGGVETISLSGLAFIGYYIGGNHQYVIVDRSANEMTLKSLDGNGQFDWGFVLTAE
jgi:hypothetical protein